MPVFMQRRHHQCHVVRRHNPVFVLVAEAELGANRPLHQMVKGHRFRRIDKRHQIPDTIPFVIFQNRFRPGNLHILYPACTYARNIRIVHHHRFQFQAVGIALLPFMKNLRYFRRLSDNFINFSRCTTLVQELTKRQPFKMSVRKNRINLKLCRIFCHHRNPAHKIAVTLPVNLYSPAHKKVLSSEFSRRACLVSSVLFNARSACILFCSLLR